MIIPVLLILGGIAILVVGTFIIESVADIIHLVKTGKHLDN